MKYRVALLRSEEGYSVWVPSLPGCCSQGETETEALENVADAIREYLDAAEDQFAGAEVREVEVPAGHAEVPGRLPPQRDPRA
jgi:predicted RNase H-like HicB family nuclease